MDTPDQRAAEKIGRAIDGQITKLQNERAVLVGAAARIIEIDAEIAVLQTEKTRIEGRRPPKPGNGNPGGNPDRGPVPG